MKRSVSPSTPRSNTSMQGDRDRKRHRHKQLTPSNNSKGKKSATSQQLQAPLPELPVSPTVTATATSAVATATTPPRAIIDPNKNDVLCGRGGQVNSHAGNIQFRDMVQARKKDYQAKTTKRVEKGNIATTIIHEIRNMKPSGRFLKARDPKQFADGDNPKGLTSISWIDIGDLQAIKKASQCLREGAPDERDSSSGVEKNDSSARDKKKAAKSVVPSLLDSSVKLSVKKAVSSSTTTTTDHKGQQRQQQAANDKGRKLAAKPRQELQVSPPRAIEPIIVPNKNDVLCGRGGRVNSHPGNIQFRDMVQFRRKDYQKKTTKRVEKGNLAAAIVSEIRTMKPSGRFLKEGLKTGSWFDIGDTKAVKKTSQCLREDYSPDIRTVLEEGDDSSSEENNDVSDDKKKASESEKPSARKQTPSTSIPVEAMVV
jgi:hypothetical protein